MSIVTHQFVRKFLHEKKCYYINSVWFFYITLNTVEKYIREGRNKFEWKRRSDCVINDDRRANAVTNNEKWSSKSVDEATAMATRYRAGTEKGSAVTPLISNISELSFLSLSLSLSFSLPFVLPPRWMRVTKDERKRGRAWMVFHVPVALSRSSRGEASRRTRLYIKWRSRFTSQIESRAIGRFSISFNNRLCYTSPFSALSACFSPSSSFSSCFVSSTLSRRPSYLRSARSPVFSFEKRIHRVSIHLALLRLRFYTLKSLKVIIDRVLSLFREREREKICEFRYVSIFYIISAAEAIAKPSSYRLKLSCNCS